LGFGNSKGTGRNDLEPGRKAGGACGLFGGFGLVGGTWMTSADLDPPMKTGGDCGLLGAELEDPPGKAGADLDPYMIAWFS
jgi:hypothetical protein